jgi:hypothetical protein
MVPDDLINPYGHSRESERPHSPVAMPNWTEHYTFYGYDAEAGHGVHIHVGRLPADPTIWRAVIQVYLPEKELFVAKYHGRDGDANGPGAGPFKAACLEPFKLWTVDFNGAMFPTARASVMREVLRDGPAEPVAFHLALEAAGPLFGRPQDLIEGRTSSTFHSEQVCRMWGYLKYRGKYVRLSGVGVRDHSSGPRDYGPVIADIWFHGLFPSGAVVQTQVVRFERAEYKTAYVFRGDGTPLEMAELLAHPHVNDMNTPANSVAADPLDEKDRTFQIVIRTKRGDELVEAELLHSGVITYFAPVEEFIGTALNRPDGIQMCEAPVRLRWNGEIGVGLRERVARTGTLYSRG